MHIHADLPLVPEVLEGVLEGFVQAAVYIIERYGLPCYPHEVKGIVWKAEPPGHEDWWLPHQVLIAGWGDCEDLAIWTAAGLRVCGSDPGARVRVVRTGVRMLHAIVEHGDGVIEDPTADLRPGVRHAS